MTSALKYKDLAGVSPDLHKPDPLFIDGNAAWSRIEGKGYGVIAAKNIPAGSVIERCPLLILPTNEIIREDGTEVAIADYSFRWGPEDNRKSPLCALTKGGYLALSNHSSDPNSYIEQDHANTMMVWIALRDIQKGEEIVHDYDCPLWFDTQSGE